MLQEATREIYFNISYHWLIYILFLPALGFFIYGVWLKWKNIREGNPVNRFEHWQQRLLLVVNHVLGHRRLLKDRGSGISHFWIFWGMMILILGTIVIMIQADLGIVIMKGSFYLVFQSLILDLVGLLAVIGLSYMLIKRYIIRSERLQTGKPDFITAGLLLLIMVQGFIIEGLRIVVTNDPWAAWSPVGYVFSLLFSGMDRESLLFLHRFFWWFHLVTAFIWIGYFAYSKIFHILAGTLNIYFSDLEPKYQAIKPIDFENTEKLGITGQEDFTWKDRLDLIACTECGRCQEVCPAYNSQKILSPRQLILNFRDEFVIDNEMVWACTTCRACMEACPVLIEHVPKVVELRRYLTMEESSIPELLQEASRSLEARFHPYKGAVSRMDWCDGLDIPTIAEVGEADILYWVGCTAAFDRRNQKVAQALTQVMKQAGLNFAILGMEENCCGDLARRTGNEFLYDMIVRSNVELLSNYKFKRIVTACPHCLHALGGEYRQFGTEYEVIHHTKLLAELGLTAQVKNVTYHDPCYLGRWNGEFETPRKILGNVFEMKRNRESSFCCGAGGGHAWMEDKNDNGLRINQMRAEEAMKTGAEGVCTACPFCLQMMEDGIKTQDPETSFYAKDIVELVAGLQIK